MNINYLLGDFLIRLKNSAMAKNKSFVFRSTKVVMATAEALKKSGFLESIEFVNKNKDMATFNLRFKNKRPVITDLKLVSKPGLRVYMDIWTLEKRRKPSILLISTPKGVLSSKEALKQNVGGEVLVEVL